MTPEFAQPVNRIFDAVLDLIDRIERHERPDLNEEKETHSDGSGCAHRREPTQPSAQKR